MPGARAATTQRLRHRLTSPPARNEGARGLAMAGSPDWQASGAMAAWTGTDDRIEAEEPLMQRRDEWLGWSVEPEGTGARARRARGAHEVRGSTTPRTRGSDRPPPTRCFRFRTDCLWF